MLRKEKPKKKFRRQSEDLEIRPKRKRNTPKQKYKKHQIWLVEEEGNDPNWQNKNQATQF